jgi:hypothetical protein
MKLHAAHVASSALLVATAALFGCSGASSPASTASAVEADAAPATAPADDAGVSEPAEAGSTCAPAPRKSGCGIEGSWIRGTAHFDASKLKAGGKPVLRVVLRHQFALVKGEETIGGRLHAYVSVPLTDPSKGEQAFAVDMCDLGTAMWSEENGAFHLVFIIDENGDNDLDTATSNEDAVVIGTPTMGELTKMVDVDVSCHAPASCLDVNVDCVGAACLTFAPIKSCKPKLPSCKSDDAFCK